MVQSHWIRPLGMVCYRRPDCRDSVRTILLLHHVGKLTRYRLRESVSNNRVKSGYRNRPSAPIDTVPSAGARSGNANGIETSQPSLGYSNLSEVEEGQRDPSSLASRSPLVSLSPVPQFPI